MPVDLWECALGFMDSQILMTAEELGIFTLLDKGSFPVSRIAQELDLEEDSLERLLNALCSLGILQKDTEDRFRNGTEASNHLVEGKPGYIGSMFKHLKEDLYPKWGQLETFVRATRARSRSEKEQSVRAFMDGMFEITYRAGQEYAAQALELDGIGHVIDVGGASGALLISLAEKNPALRGTVCDLGHVRSLAEENFKKYGMIHRLSFRETDFFHDPLPKGADAYFLSFILHDWDHETGSMLLEKIREAAPSNSFLIISEYLLNEDRTGPLHVSRSDMNMMVAASGRERSASEYENWLREFGFSLQEIRYASHCRGFLIARKQGTVTNNQEMHDSIHESCI